MIHLRVPGDKSISHRALILAALASGGTRIRSILRSADVESTAGVLRALGVSIPPLTDDLVIHGIGTSGLRSPGGPLDCGNSGTTTRLMAGVLAGARLRARFVGDASLSARPMRRVAAPLEAMGARVALPPHGGLPMDVSPEGPLRGLCWHSEVASAQVKGALLLAGVIGGVPVEVHEPVLSRDHTERMLRARGVNVVSEGTAVTLHPGGAIRAADQTVPGDPSSAAFLAGLAALGAAREGVAIEQVGLNPTRVGAFVALERMGARLSYESRREEGGEPVATLLVSTGALRATTIAPEEVPSLIDELPLLACVAARAEGETRVTGADELRVKESDRIRAIVENLRAVGVAAEELPDGFVVRGGDAPLKGTIRTHGDHRIAMAFGVLGAVEGNAIEVDDRSCVAVSYPSFWDDLTRLR